MMFEPKEGSCFHCGAATLFPSNWKNDWFICDGCLGLVLPLLRRKVPSALVLKSQRSVTYTTLWKPFKPMALDPIRDTLEYALRNAQLAEGFEPTVMRCGEAFELDEAQGLFRARTNGGLLSPVLSLSSVTDFYVQEVYHVGRKGYKNYDHAELTIETSVPCVPFVDFRFEFPKSGGGMLRSKAKMRQEADEELSGILGRKTSETRRRVVPRFNDLMEFNPYSASTADEYLETVESIFGRPD